MPPRPPGHSTALGVMTLPAGTRLEGRYTIQSVLAAGGFGITYLARHDRLGRAVAIKEHFPRQLAYRDATTSEVRPTDPNDFRWTLDRFLQEGQSLSRCRHPNVVEVADVFEANGTAYMVLGFEQGESLKRWLKGLNRPATQGEVDRFLPPLLDALAYVHAQGLLHRDIAPDNIMLRPDGSPCLIDFGSARQAQMQRSGKMSAIVKHGFSPPEQYTSSGRDQGPWSDIYALGATLYFVATGVAVTASPDRHMSDDVKPAARVARGQFRPGFLAAIDHAIRLIPADRPQSVGAWRAELMGGAPVPPAQRSTVVAPTPVRPEASRARPGGQTQIARQTQTQQPTQYTQPPPAAPPRPAARSGSGLALPGLLLTLTLGAAAATYYFAELRGPPIPPPASQTGAPGGIGASLNTAGSQTGARPAEPSPPPRPAMTETLNLRMSTVFPMSIDAGHGSALRFAERVAQQSGQRITFQTYASGEIVPAFEVASAVAAGVIDAGWTIGNYGAGKEKALGLVSGRLPIDVPAPSLVRWARTPAALAARQAAFDRIGVKAIPCAVVGPAGLWAKRALASAADLKALKVRATGLTGATWQRLGASSIVLPAGEIYPALERGVIDATEGFTAEDDVKLGFAGIARHYHYPTFGGGSAYLIDFVMKPDRWALLSPGTKYAIEDACQASLDQSLAAIDVLERTALDSLRQKGATVHRFPEALAQAMREAGRAELEAQARGSPLAAEIWATLQRL